MIKITDIRYDQLFEKGSDTCSILLIKHGSPIVKVGWVCNGYPMTENIDIHELVDFLNKNHWEKV